MKKYKIIYERDNCIGAAACAVVTPDLFKMNDDDQKADLIEGKSIDEENNLFERIIELDDEKLKELLESAESCPVNIIHVEELATGKKLI